MSRAVVFGGAGFLGSHVVDALDRAGHGVRVFDCRPSPWLAAQQEMRVGDILDFDAVLAAVADADIVYHYAGQADLDASAQEPLRTVQLNVLGTANILEACRRHGVGRFVFASSVYVCSDLGSIYRSTKQACERLVRDYQREFGVPFTVLRYGSLYGPRANRFNAIQKFIEQAIREGCIVRDGDGEELREYVHVRDAAEASVRILSDEFVNEFVTISGAQAIRVRDLLTMVREMMHGDVEIRFRPERANARHHYAITPFSFRPERARRLTLNTYHELGQGLLELLYEAYENQQRSGFIPEPERANADGNGVAPCTAGTTASPR